ncbi:hypothetical protein ACQKBB_07325, partial [Helicobacter pylori]
NQNKSFFHYIDLKAILWYFLHRIFKAFVLSITIPTIYGFSPKPCVRKSFLIFKLHLIVFACFKG